MQIARRCAYLSTMCELMEAKPIMELPELSVYATMTSHLSRAFKLLGLKRAIKDVTLTLPDYLAARARAAERPKGSSDESYPHQMTRPDAPRDAGSE
jgi:hypothetical protein